MKEDEPRVAQRRVDDENRKEQDLRNSENEAVRFQWRKQREKRGTNNRFEGIEQHRERLVHHPGEDHTERDDEESDLYGRSHRNTHREVEFIYRKAKKTKLRYRPLNSKPTLDRYRSSPFRAANTALVEG